MDSSIPPPPPSRSALRLRPWYLVAAMMITWLSGVAGLLTGLQMVRFIRASRITASALSGMESMALDFQTTVLGHARTMLPLAIAQAILSGLLVVASGLAMSGRRGARSLALQAILANALLAVIAYALTTFLRVVYAEALARIPQALPPNVPREAAVAIGWWHWRLKLIFIDLGPLALGLLALTRARTRAFFDAMARATESAEDQ